jgi:hypothetical protein
MKAAARAAQRQRAQKGLEFEKAQRTGSQLLNERIWQETNYRLRARALAGRAASRARQKRERLTPAETAAAQSSINLIMKHLLS